MFNIHWLADQLSRMLNVVKAVDHTLTTSALLLSERQQPVKEKCYSIQRPIHSRFDWYYFRVAFKSGCNEQLSVEGNACHCLLLMTK